MLHIAYLDSHYLMQRGGAQQHVHRLVQELALLGHDMTLITAEGPLRPYQDANYRVVALPRSMWREALVRSLVRLEKVRGFYRFFHWLFPDECHLQLQEGPWCPAIYDAAIYDPYDVVVIINHGKAWPVLQPAVLKKLKGKLKVATPLFHVREMTKGLARLKLRYSNYDLILTNSDYERDWLIGMDWGRERIHTTGVGSDPWPVPPVPGTFRKRHGIPEEAPLILFVGRKIYNKGIVHVIQSMDRVWDIFPDARLALLGFARNPPSWLEGWIKSLRHDAGDRIIDLDDVEDQTREEALCDCDVFVMPSISDSFGIAYLDAWRYGKPVIGCKETSSETIIRHGEDGLLVGFGDVASLGDAVVSILTDGDRRRKMGETGRMKWQTTYRWELMAARTEALLKEHLPAI